jgi:hypothetical protein
MIYGELEATNYQFLLEEKTMDDAFGVCQWGRFFYHISNLWKFSIVDSDFFFFFVFLRSNIVSTRFCILVILAMDYTYEVCCMAEELFCFWNIVASFCSSHS